MIRLTRWLSAKSTPKASPHRFVPRVQALDDRITPSFLTSILTQGNTASTSPDISADGRFVAFLSNAQLTSDDTNAFQDVYLRDRVTGTITLVSRADGAGGAAGNGAVSFAPSISADGRFVVFDSAATNLVAGDANAQPDIFVRDVVNGTTTLVSRASGVSGVQGNGQSVLAAISADGKFVSFASQASNLVAGDTNFDFDVFVRDLANATTTRVSTDSNGVQTGFGLASEVNDISADGRFVAFRSDGTNLVLNDTNAVSDVFVKDLQTGTTVRVSVDNNGVQGNLNSAFAVGGLSISDDGKKVAFESLANNLVTGDSNAVSDVFVRDLTAGTTTRVSTDPTGQQGNGASQGPWISGNGRFVAFDSGATNLVDGDTNALVDVFLKDLVTGVTTRLSLASDGTTQGNGNSQNAALNRDGQFVAFDSAATNLAAGDANAVTDVFVNQHPLPALFVAAPAAGGSSQIRVFKPDGSQVSSFLAYPAAYTGGAFVALGDVNGDGIDEIVTSTGPGGAANIRIFDQNGGLKQSFFAYPEAFTGGVNVAIGDVDNDGFADIVCGVGKNGGPNIRILSGKQVSLGNFGLSPLASGGALIASFFAYAPNFTGGVRVAVADVNGDGFADVICAVGSGGGPNVRVLDGKQLSLGNFSLSPLSAGGALISSYFAVASTFTGGLFVSSGDVNNDGVPDIITGVESGGGPNVRAFSGKTEAPLSSFFGFDSALTGGVRVASTDLNQDGFDDYVVGTGPGVGGTLRVFSGKDGSTQLLTQFAPFGGFGGGVNVG